MVDVDDGAKTRVKWHATIERDGAIDHIVTLDDVAELLTSLVGAARR